MGMTAEQIAALLDNGETVGGAVADNVQTMLAYRDALANAVAEQEAVVRKMKDSIDSIEQFYVPRLLSQQGLVEIKLSNGDVVSVVHDVFATIPKKDEAKRKEAFDWLSANGADALIKDTVTFDPNERQDAVQALDDLGVEYETTHEVNAQTLRAYFRNVLGLKKGSEAVMSEEEIPSCFGLYIQNKVKVS